MLVHGACHGAWCWYKVATLLRSAGHRVTALDLAAAGANGKRFDELNSISDYYEPLMEFMASLGTGEKVILVAHSLGGVSVSVAMERFPHKISVAVFVAALMPGPDFNFPTVSQEVFSLFSWTKRIFPFQDASSNFYMELDWSNSKLIYIFRLVGCVALYNSSSTKI